MARRWFSTGNPVSMQKHASTSTTTHLLRDLFRMEQGSTDVSLATWRFVYVFFSNGTPFDAPNRSETCHSA
jgi:hypothetical protein